MNPVPLDFVTGLFFWGFIVLYGATMYALSPPARSVSSFFRGTDESGRPASEWALMCSIFISWIFAKSVTNAANLGAAYGVVGGLAYAAYWLWIPLAGGGNDLRQHKSHVHARAAERPRLDQGHARAAIHGFDGGGERAAPGADDRNVQHHLLAFSAEG